MRIGISYDLKAADDAGLRPGVPDDWQEEYDSPVTIDAIAKVMVALGHEVVHLGDGRPLLDKILADPPDFVFNLAEGHGTSRSREARVPAVLEMLGIPYSGSDPLTLAVTLDKDCAKRLVQSAGVAVPRGLMVSSNTPTGAECNGARGLDIDVSRLRFPVLVKPAWEGSSKGIRSHCLVDRATELSAVVDSLLDDHQQPVLIEEFIQGDEITVGIVGNPPQILGVMRVSPRQPTDRFIYSLEVKRDFQRQVRYECPPTLPAAVNDAIARAAMTTFDVLGCRDFARVDFRLRDNIPYFLEVNPLPGLNPDTSDLVILARLRDWTYAQLVGAIVDAALSRVGLVAAA
jgi:D-alanine-D-alanine ligase